MKNSVSAVDVKNPKSANVNEVADAKPAYRYNAQVMSFDWRKHFGHEVAIAPDEKGNVCFWINGQKQYGVFLFDEVKQAALNGTLKDVKDRLIYTEWQYADDTSDNFAKSIGLLPESVMQADKAVTF